MKNEQNLTSNAPRLSQDQFDLLVETIVARRKAGEANDKIRADIEALGTPLTQPVWNTLLFAVVLEEVLGKKKPWKKTAADEHPGLPVVARIFAAHGYPKEEEISPIIILRTNGVWRTETKKEE